MAKVHLFTVPNDQFKSEHIETLLKAIGSAIQTSGAIVVPEGLSHKEILFEKGDKIAIVKENERVARIE